MIKFSALKASYLIFFTSISISIATGATINVPKDYPTIQLGIDAAANGDTVLVAPGTYVENIDFMGKAVTVRSSGGKWITVINGNKSRSVVTFNSFEGSGSVLDGFTLTNGKGTFCSYGPGYNGYFGGGIICSGSSPVIINNNITKNTVDWGGGIFCNNSSPTIYNNTISGNKADFGGGIQTWDYSFPAITSNNINGNLAKCGGGISCGSSSCPIIKNNNITGNTVDSWGGGIFINYSSPIIANNTLAENMADAGGSIYCHNYSSPVILNNLITKNVAVHGGALYSWENTSPNISNTTFTKNSAMHGGGIYCWDGASPIITNTIIWNNNTNSGSEIHLANLYGIPSTLTISHSDVKGGKQSVYADPGCKLNWGPGMIDKDPLFTTGPKGFYYLSQIASGQVFNSPCIDIGNELASTLGMSIFWTRTDETPDMGTVDLGYHYGQFIYPSLQIDTLNLSENVGGSANFLLLGDTVNANKNYLIFGSVSGNSPGITFPGGAINLPINWDLFTNIAIIYANTSFFQNFMGALDSSGRNEAMLSLPPIPGFAGTTMSFAYGLVDSFGTWDFASNPLTISIVP